MSKLIQSVDGITVAEYPLTQPRIRIGRSADNDICIEDPAVSQYHAEIEAVASPDNHNAAAYRIVDRQSTNSTYVNGSRIDRHLLQHNDVVRVGLSNLTFIDESRAETEKTVKIRKSWIPGVYYTN